MSEKDLKHIIDMSSHKINYNRLKSGKDDGDYDTEEAFMNAGWVKIRIDRRSGGYSLDSIEPQRKEKPCMLLQDPRQETWWLG